ncbi:MAG: DinB family protein [Candidatus Longimicrobiales bacterium M2_2A_002]
MPEHAIPLDEFDYEMDATRRLLERVPTEQGEWKPHEKSFPLGHLAQLVSWMPGWVTSALRDDAYDFVEQGVEYSFEPTEVLLAALDRNAAAARTAIEEVTGEALDEGWTLKSADMELFTAPRSVAARNHLNHLIHHRGQLTVYLRLLDVPLPPIYGPTADER